MVQFWKGLDCGNIVECRERKRLVHKAAWHKGHGWEVFVQSSICGSAECRKGGHIGTALEMAGMVHFCKRLDCDNIAEYEERRRPFHKATWYIGLELAQFDQNSIYGSVYCTELHHTETALGLECMVPFWERQDCGSTVECEERKMIVHKAVWYKGRGLELFDQSNICGSAGCSKVHHTGIAWEMVGMVHFLELHDYGSIVECEERSRTVHKVVWCKGRGWALVDQSSICVSGDCMEDHHIELVSEMEYMVGFWE